MKKSQNLTLANIGTLKSDQVSFIDDYLSISVDIEELAPEIMDKVNAAVEIEKERYIKERNEYAGKNEFWSEEGTDTEFIYLDIELNRNMKPKYKLVVGICDRVNGFLESSVYIPVDLSDDCYIQLRKMALKAVIDMFF